MEDSIVGELRQYLLQNNITLRAETIDGIPTVVLHGPVSKEFEKGLCLMFQRYGFSVEASFDTNRLNHQMPTLSICFQGQGLCDLPGIGPELP